MCTKHTIVSRTETGLRECRLVSNTWVAQGVEGGHSSWEKNNQIRRVYPPALGDPFGGKLHAKRSEAGRRYSWAFSECAYANRMP